MAKLMNSFNSGIELIQFFAKNPYSCKNKWSVETIGLVKTLKEFE